MGFLGGASGKEPTCQCKRHKTHGFHPWIRKIPWRRAWQPTPVFLPGKFHGQRSLLESADPWPHGVTQRQTRLRQLSMAARYRLYTHTHAHTHTYLLKPNNGFFSCKKYTWTEGLYWCLLPIWWKIKFVILFLSLNNNRPFTYQIFRHP